MTKYEIRRSNDPIDRWDIFIDGHFWTGAFTKQGARHLVKKSKKKYGER